MIEIIKCSLIINKGKVIINAQELSCLLLANLNNNMNGLFETEILLNFDNINNKNIYFNKYFSEFEQLFYNKLIITNNEQITYKLILLKDKNSITSENNIIDKNMNIK